MEFEKFFEAEKIETPSLHNIPEEYFNQKLKMDGFDLLSKIPFKSVPVVFFDPQYRGILDKMSYGNEGENRGKDRTSLQQMDEITISEFIRLISCILVPSGHLFLWIDKFHLLEGYRRWIEGTNLSTVDMVTWDKEKMGMGYRTRRVSEYLVVFQKEPKRAKGVWKKHNIRDVWTEKIENKIHTHQKPLNLQIELIEATTEKGNIVVDPAAGSFSVMESAKKINRNFLGCDIDKGTFLV